MTNKNQEQGFAKPLLAAMLLRDGTAFSLSPIKASPTLAAPSPKRIQSLGAQFRQMQMATTLRNAGATVALPALIKVTNYHACYIPTFINRCRAATEHRFLAVWSGAVHKQASAAYRIKHDNKFRPLAPFNSLCLLTTASRLRRSNQS